MSKQNWKWFLEDILTIAIGTISGTLFGTLIYLLLR